MNLTPDLVVCCKNPSLFCLPCLGVDIPCSDKPSLLWLQKDFLETCKPTMDVTDALLVQLYDSILVSVALPPPPSRRYRRPCMETSALNAN